MANPDTALMAMTTAIIAGDALETLAHQVAFTYAALSNACHYHPYELAPTAAELGGWIEDVTVLVERITAG